MNTIKTPLISIITVSYNAVSTIEQTILSVINQGFEDYEYIIIDGGSTDGTIEIIEKYQDRITFWVSEPDKGIYDAMNKGIKIGKGELVSLLNSDDWYEKDALIIVANNFYSNPNVDVFHGLLRIINIANDEPSMICGHYNSNLYDGMIEHPTCFVKRELFEKVGGFDLSYKSAADYDWMLRVKNTGARFLLIHEIVANFRNGGISSSLGGSFEDILIKKRYGIYSNSKYLQKKLILFLIGFRNIISIK
jgi:glycosyltransferase involved in cell wall biosynthesis